MNQNIKELCKSLRLAYVAEVYNQIEFESVDQFLKDLGIRSFEWKPPSFDDLQG